MVKHHEQYAELANSDSPSNRNFGLTMAGVFMLATILGKYKFHSPLMMLILLAAISIVFLCVTLFNASMLTRLNSYWSALGRALQRITSPIIMFMIYALVFVPIGLLLKIMGKNTMQLFRTGEASFWINKPKAELPDPMKYQF